MADGDLRFPVENRPAQAMALLAAKFRSTASEIRR